MHKIYGRIQAYIRALKTSILKLIGRSDYFRWTPVDSLASNWDSRTMQIAKLISENSSVIEFGAGRQILRDYLPQGCQYTPSDLVDRGRGTIVCDLNSDALPQFSKFDFAVFAGVMEYVNDIPRIVRHLKQSV